MQKPDIGEYNPYFQKYIDQITEGDFYSLFKQSTLAAISFFEKIPVEKHDHAYAKDKWTVKQVLMHIIDAERVFSYRALVAARGDDKTELQSFDDNLYAHNVAAGKRSMDSLLEEFKIIRRSAEILFENITEEQSKFEANAGTYPITVRALGYITMGHTMHHINIIKERYL